MAENRKKNLVLFVIAMTGLLIAILSGTWEHLSMQAIGPVTKARLVKRLAGGVRRTNPSLQQEPCERRRDDEESVFALAENLRFDSEKNKLTFWL